VPRVHESGPGGGVSEPLPDEPRALLANATGAVRGVLPTAGPAAMLVSGWVRDGQCQPFELDRLRRLVPPLVVAAGTNVDPAAARNHTADDHHREGARADHHARHNRDDDNGPVDHPDRADHDYHHASADDEYDDHREHVDHGHHTSAR
jgi:hypothetical protein